MHAAVFGRNLERDGWPSVAVIMPVRDEAEGLRTAVESILEQDYPEPFEICLAIAPSTDGTESLAGELARAYPSVLTVANPVGTTPAALNQAIRATASAIVVRVDGHSRLSAGYIRRAVETMVATGAVNVGGVQHPVGATEFERTVATALRSRLGTGGAKFHVGGEAGPVDTVYLGVFDRVAGDKVGWFDTSLIRNQDYELNIRLSEAGGTVWFDPQLSVSYRPRGSYRALAEQYYGYGVWKARVLEQHPGSLKARQALPAAMPIVAGAGALAMSRLPRSGRRTLLTTAALATAAMAPRFRYYSIVATMHSSWIAGIWSGGIRQLIARGRTKR